jgi:hypothetical protein
MEKKNTCRIANTQYILPHKPYLGSESLVWTKMASSTSDIGFLELGFLLEDCSKTNFLQDSGLIPNLLISIN